MSFAGPEAVVFQHFISVGIKNHGRTFPNFQNLPVNKKMQVGLHRDHRYVFTAAVAEFRLRVEFSLHLSLLFAPIASLKDKGNRSYASHKGEGYMELLALGECKYR